MLGQAKSGSRHAFKRAQGGMTLIELLVAGVISIIAVSGMVIVMANTLGTGSKTIQMVRLTQEMRTAMQIMTRELRRANYHSTFLSCYGNVSCLTNIPVLGDITDKIREIGIGDSAGTDDCLWFWYQRPDKDLAASPVAGFRRALSPRPDNSVVGVIQMTTALTSAAACGDDYDVDDWVDITDPGIIDVLTFEVSNSESVLEIINADLATQSVERIGLTMTAKLVIDPLAWTGVPNANMQRELQEFIKVRNNITSP